MDRRLPYPYSFPRCLLCQHGHWIVVVPRGWVKASTCRLQVNLYCTVICQIVSLQYLSRSSVSPPLSYFLVVWSPRGDMRGPLVVFEAVGVPFPGPFHFAHIADYTSAICPLSLNHMLVFLSLYTMLSILLSILVPTTAILFCACFCECPGLCTMSKLATQGVVHVRLQADGNGAFEDTSYPGFGVYICPGYFS